MVVGFECARRNIAAPVSRAVLGLNGGPTDALVVDLGCELAQCTRPSWSRSTSSRSTGATTSTRTSPGSRELASAVLDLAEGVAESARVSMRAELLQARDVGAALVDEAVALDADADHPRACPTASGSAATSPSGGPSPTCSRTRPAGLSSCASRSPTAAVARRLDREGSTERCAPSSSAAGASAPAWPSGWPRRATTSPSSTSGPTRSTGCEQDFPGQAIRGDGTDEDVLRRVGRRGRGLVLRPDRGRQPQHPRGAAGRRDVRGPAVVAKINDPVRAEAYAALGIATICRTDMDGRRAGALHGPAGGPGASDVAPRRATTRHAAPDHAGRDRGDRPAGGDSGGARCTSSSWAAARSATT